MNVLTSLVLGLSTLVAPAASTPISKPAIAAPVHPVVVLVQKHVPPVPVAIMRQWLSVFRCETHNWKDKGPTYMGGLGITQWNWTHNGGSVYSVSPFGASPEQQVKIAIRIQRGYPIPDQNGECNDW